MQLKDSLDRLVDLNEQSAIFCVPPLNVITDLCGDPTQADFVAFMNGNQFMVLPQLMDAFCEEVPSVENVFYESLPPGVLVEQVRLGRLRMGTLELALKADVLAASPDALERLHSENLVGEPTEYASNDLVMLVAKGNPAGIHEIADLGRERVRLAMPDPDREGVGRLMVSALESAGGPPLVKRVMETKTDTGETLLTEIHHRQTPTWLLDGTVDVGPVWRTEAQYHLSKGADFEVVELPDKDNQMGRYAVAAVTQAPHPEISLAFLQFIVGKRAQDIYRCNGFAAPIADG